MGEIDVSRWMNVDVVTDPKWVTSFLTISIKPKSIQD